MYRIASALLLLCPLVTWAAPMASGDGVEAASSKSPEIVVPAAGANGTAGVAGIPQSKTVELLLQMQDQQAQKSNGGAESAGGTATVPRASPSRATAAVDAAAQPDETPLNSLKSAILNSPLAKPGDAQDSSVQAQRAGLRMEPAGLPKTSSESSSSLLNQPVIRFIRENRGLTMLGCAVALAAVWATATFSSSRRSRSRSR